MRTHVVTRRARARAALQATAALAFVAAGCGAGAATTSGKRAPEIAGASSADGASARLEDFRGQWVVLSFGASWCVPCKHELPAWQALAATYAARRAPVVFVAVNVDESRERGKQFTDALGLRDMRVLFDPAQHAVQRYDPPTMPTTYIIDPRGVVRYVHPGYQPGDEQKLAAKLDGLLAS